MPLVLFGIKGSPDQARDDHGRWTNGGGGGSGASSGQHAPSRNGSTDAAWKAAATAVVAGVALTAAAPIVAALAPPAVAFSIGSTTIGVATSALTQSAIGALADHALYSAAFHAADAVSRDAGVSPEHATTIARVAEQAARLSGPAASAYRAFFKSTSPLNSGAKDVADQLSAIGKDVAARIVSAVKAKRPDLTSAQTAMLRTSVDGALTRFLATVRQAAG